MRPPITPFYTYTLGSSLYVPLTCRCNSLTLPETRGPNFVLPRDVVASLLRVREMELRPSVKEDEWDIKSLDLLMEGSEKLKLPSLLNENKVREYPTKEVGNGNETGVHPRISDLLSEIQQQINDKQKVSNPIQSMVIAGEGEPTLRFQDLLSLTDQLSSSSWFPTNIPIRLTTNGLISNGQENIPQILQSHGISQVSVALMSGDPQQYHQLMEPMVPNAHARVCQFLEQATGSLQVEVTAVDRPEVDKAQLESLAKSLSVNDPVRWRPYFG